MSGLTKIGSRRHRKRLSDAATQAQDYVRSSIAVRQTDTPTVTEPTDVMTAGELPVPVWMGLWFLEAMQKADLHPALSHAYSKTGFLLSEMNGDAAPASEVSQWDAALNEWEQRNGEAVSRRRLTEDEFSQILRYTSGDPPSVA